MERKLPESAAKRMRSHTVSIENRELLCVSGVKAVDSFNEFEVCLITDAGELHIEGTQLNITKLDLDDGQVVVEGEIHAMEYQDGVEQKGSLFSRMFK